LSSFSLLYMLAKVLFCMQSLLSPGGCISTSSFDLEGDTHVTIRPLINIQNPIVAHHPAQQLPSHYPSITTRARPSHPRAVAMLTCSSATPSDSGTAWPAPSCTMCWRPKIAIAVLRPANVGRLLIGYRWHAPVSGQQEVKRGGMQ
jgi:hypothetical protein